MAAVFPSLAACQDNAPAGPIEIPIIRSCGRPWATASPRPWTSRASKHCCAGSRRDVRLHFVDTVEPSVLAHEILNGAPFTYLDEDTEIGERRSRAVPLRRGLPVEPVSWAGSTRTRSSACGPRRPRRARPRRAP